MPMKNLSPFVCQTALVAALAGIVAITTILPASADEVITLNYTRAAGGATVSQSYLLVHEGDPGLTIANPIATLLLFVGGGGRLRLSNQQLHIDAVNFLLRTRHLFAARGPFDVAVMDAASDFLNSGLFPKGLRGQRVSAQYLEDMQRVTSDLRARFPGLPIWAVGTSRGSIAAALVAAQLNRPQGPDGVVLTSSVTVWLVPTRSTMLPWATSACPSWSRLTATIRVSSHRQARSNRRLSPGSREHRPKLKCSMGALQRSAMPAMLSVRTVILALSRLSSAT